MFVFRLTGPILLAVNISSTATEKEKWCHLFPPTSKYYSQYLQLVHISLDMLELAAGSDKHS